MQAKIMRLRRPLFAVAVGATAGSFLMLAIAAYVGALSVQDAAVGGSLAALSTSLLLPMMFAGRMESLANMGDIGDIGGIVGSVIALGVAAIILLTFSVPLIGDMDTIAVQARSGGYCEVNGDRFDRVVLKGSNTDANTAWENATSTEIVQLGSTTKTAKTTAADSANGGACQHGDLTAAAYFTPKGSQITAKADYIEGNSTRQSRSLGALSSGSLIALLFGAMAILIPAGALAGLAWFGSSMVQKNIGGNTLAIALGATVSVIIVAAILPELFGPLDILFVALDGQRFYVYSQGIGRIAGVLGNFLGIALVAGLIGLGKMLWDGVGRARRGGAAREMM